MVRARDNGRSLTGRARCSRAPRAAFLIRYARGTAPAEAATDTPRERRADPYGG